MATWQDSCLIDFLKDKSIDVRITNGDKWLVWYQDLWVVFQRPFGKKNNRCLYSGDDLNEALQALKSGAEA